MTTAQDPTAEAQMPRLSIFHIMLWTFCTAFLLAMTRVIYSLQEMDDGFLMVQQSSNILYGMVNGAVLAGAIVLIYTRLQSGPPLVRHPGHWLLIVPAPMVIAYFFLAIVNLIVADSNNHGFPFVYFIGYPVVYVGEAIAFCIASWQAQSKAWRILFVGQAISFGLSVLSLVAVILQSYSPIIWSLPSWCRLALSGWAIVAVIIDFRRGRQRDWLHWAGVGAFVAQSAITFGTRIAQSLIGTS